MRNNRISATLYLSVVFLSGAVVGGFAHRLYMVNTVSTASRPARPSPEEYRKRYIQEMHTRLKLDDAQVASLRQVMDETGQRLRDLRERDKPLLQSIDDDHVRKIEALLTPEQKTVYAKMREEREKRRQEHGGGRGPGPHGF